MDCTLEKRGGVYSVTVGKKAFCNLRFAGSWLGFARFVDDKDQPLTIQLSAEDVESLNADVSIDTVLISAHPKLFTHLPRKNRGKNPRYWQLKRKIRGK